MGLKIVPWEIENKCHTKFCCNCFWDRSVPSNRDIYNCDDLLSYNSSPRSSHMWFSYIHNFIIILSRVYNELIQRPAPSWLVSSIDRALHWYRRGQGLESRRMIFFHIILHLAVLMWFSYTVKRLLSGHHRDLPKCALNEGDRLIEVCKSCAMLVND